MEYPGGLPAQHRASNRPHGPSGRWHRSVECGAFPATIARCYRAAFRVSGVPLLHHGYRYPVRCRPGSENLARLAPDHGFEADSSHGRSQRESKGTSARGRRLSTQRLSEGDDSSGATLEVMVRKYLTRTPVDIIARIHHDHPLNFPFDGSFPEKP